MMLSLDQTCITLSSSFTTSSLMEWNFMQMCLTYPS